jgi:asparagine synthase (glutamine-hydrolysing)
MSALAGIVRFDGGAPDQAAVARMIDCVEHRGRGYRGLRVEGTAALAYRWHRSGRLQTVDTQPVFDRLSQALLVFDGRLDNRPDLSRELDVRDEPGVSDAEFVLAAYQRWGGDVLSRLLGDFALAIWDGRERRLTLARDPRGVRALAYAVVGNAVAFATEPRQLLRVAGVDAAPNLGFFGERLTGIASHPSDTIFRGIHRVPAAHAAAATASGISVTAHWTIEPGREVRYADDRQYAEHLRDLCERAVSARLRGVDRAAVLLSSGVDSSSVLALAAHAADLGRPVDVRAYNHALPGLADSDEGPGAQRTASHLGVPFVSVPFQPASLDYHRERAGWIEDTMPGSLGVSEDTLSARIAGDGCGVALTGVGGDEWLAGAYLHTADLLAAGRIAAGVRQLWDDAHNPDVFHGIGVLARTCGWALTPDRVRQAVRRMRPEPDRAPPGFTRSFVDATGLVDRVTPAPIANTFPTLAAGAVFRGAMHPHGIYAWEESARQVGLFGCELSAPLLDRRIAEFAMAIPEEQRCSGRQTKRVLRAAMTGVLPDDVRVVRRKSDPGAAVAREVERLHAAGALQNLEIAAAGILDAAAVDDMYSSMVRMASARQNRYKVLAYRLWTFFAGDCVWRRVFGSDAPAGSMRAPMEACSGREAASTGWR